MTRSPRTWAQASQLSLLVAIVIAAGSLAFDAGREWSAFLRTRVPSAARIVLPKFAVNAAAVGAAFTVGALAAWYETAVLLGGLPVSGMLAGIALGVLYLVFAVAAVALAAGLMRSTVGASAVALALLIALPLIGAIVDPIARWLPSHLVGALTALVAGSSATEFVPAATIRWRRPPPSCGSPCA